MVIVFDATVAAALAPVPGVDASGWVVPAVVDCTGEQVVAACCREDVLPAALQLLLLVPALLLMTLFKLLLFSFAGGIPGWPPSPTTDGPVTIEHFISMGTIDKKGDTKNFIKICTGSCFTRYVNILQ